MKVTTISQNLLVTKNQSNQKTNYSPNFGIRLMVEDSIPKFVIKEAVNCALKNNVDPNAAIQNGFQALLKSASGLLRRLEPVEPKELPVFLKLTPKAYEYISNPQATGEMFDTMTNSVNVEMPIFGGRIVKGLKQFLPDEETMARIEYEIRDMISFLK